MKASRCLISLWGMTFLLTMLAAGVSAQEIQPKEWENLRLWPGQAVSTLGAGSSWPALAASDDQLLLGEIFAGGVYLSALDPQTLAVGWTKPVAPALAGRERTDLHATVVGQKTWLAWLEAPAGTAAGTPRSLKLASFDLTAQTASAAREIAITTQVALTCHNQQLWLVWLGPAASGGLSLSAGAQEDAFVVTWQPSAPGSPVAVGLGDLGADLCLPFVTRQGGRLALWQASYNGHRFFGVRKLRGLGEMGPPAICRLQNRLLILYTLFPGAAETGYGDGYLAVTVTDTVGARLASDTYLADGNVNLYPSLASLNNTVYVAYNAWSAHPDTAAPGQAINRGIFIGKIEPQF